jgi:hypothetical protein
MKIYRGDTAETAIVIPAKAGELSRSDQIIDATINEMFGSRNGDFFVHASQLRRDITGKTYKIVLVEDKDAVRHQVYFLLSYT